MESQRSGLQVALEVWSNDVAAIRRGCLHAEASGLDGFYYGESPTGLNVDCWSMLSSLTSATKQLRLGPVIANVLLDYRSLAALGRQVATLAVLSDGRADFRSGVGASAGHAKPWWQPYGVSYPRYAERLTSLDNALRVLQRFWLGQPTNFGAEGSDALGPVLGFDCPPIPVTVAATGSRAMELATNHADIWETSFCTVEEFQEVQRSVGSGLRRSLEIDGFVGTSEARASAVLAAARRDRAGEDFGPIIARALAGGPVAVAQQMAALHAAGVDQLVVALHDPLELDAITALGQAKALLDPG